MKKIFLICPVRGLTKEVNKKITRYVSKLEKKGAEVHWPPRDTDQSDPIGLEICKTNARAILEADEVHIWFEQTSTGSIFDFGIYFALTQLCDCKKKLVIANKKEVKPTPHKSFQNVLLALAK